MEQALINTYKWQRKYANPSMQPAQKALKVARHDVEAKISRYPDSQQFKRNHPFMVESYKLEWMEQPEHFGLRFVGYADEIYKRNYDYLGGLEHTGHYTDEDYYKTLRGAVFQLPARNGQPVYVAGYVEFEGENPINSNSAAVNLSRLFMGTHGGESEGPSYEPIARECAEYSNRIAECMAESEREYAEAWDKGRKYSELGEEVTTLRQRCLATLAALREVRKVNRSLVTISDAAAEKICGTMKETISMYLQEIKNARLGRINLKNDVYQSGHKAAFNEGAGEKVFL